MWDIISDIKHLEWVVENSHNYLAYKEVGRLIKITLRLKFFAFQTYNSSYKVGKFSIDSECLTLVYKYSNNCPIKKTCKIRWT